MRYQSTFSTSRDAALFLLPLLVALCIYIVALAFGSISQMDFPLFFLLYLLIDFPHLYSTSLRVIYSNENRMHTVVAVGTGAIVCFIFLLFLFSYTDYGWSVLAYIAIFHFMRQQIGWLKLLQDGQSYFYSKLEVSAMYAIVVSGILFWHSCRSASFFWFPGAVNIPTAVIFSNICDVVMIVLCVLCLYIKVKDCKNEIIIRPAKIYLLLSTIFTWQIMLRLVPLTPVSFAIFNTVTHGLPYLIWIFWFYSFQSSRTKYLFFIPMMFYLLFIFLGIVENYFYFGSMRKEEFQLFSQWKMIGGAKTSKVFLCLALTPQMIHFIADGFVWKIKKSPELREFINYLKRTN